MGKFIRIFVIVLLLVVVFAFISLETAVRLNGKKIVAENLRRAFQRETSVDDVRYIFPISLRLDNVEVVNAFSAKVVYLTFGVPRWNSRQIVLNEVLLKSPRFTLEKTEDSGLSWSSFAEAKYRGGPAGPSKTYDSTENAGEEKPRSVPPPSESHDVLRPSVTGTLEKMWRAGVYIEKIKVIDGKVSLIDYTYAPELKMSIKDVTLDARPVLYPLRSLKTRIECAGSVEQSNTFFQGSWFESTGWIDLAKKDMDLSLKIIEPDGTVGLEANLTSQDNKALVKGHMKIARGMEATGAAGRAAASPADAFWRSLNRKDINMDVRFSFQTTLDNFHVGRVLIQGDLGLGEL